MSHRVFFAVDINHRKVSRFATGSRCRGNRQQRLASDMDRCTTRGNVTSGFRLNSQCSDELRQVNCGSSAQRDHQVRVELAKVTDTAPDILQFRVQLEVRKPRRCVLLEEWVEDVLRTR